jgi:nucleoid DNA-binding protein
MKQAELIANIAEETGLSRVKATAFLKSFANQVKAAIESGEIVPIEDFGKFHPLVRKGRTARNPRTGKEVKTKTKNTMKFRISSVLEAKFN